MNKSSKKDPQQFLSAKRSLHTVYFVRPSAIKLNAKNVSIFLNSLLYWKLIFIPMTLTFRPSVCRLVGWSVCLFIKGREKFHFLAPIGAVVYIHLQKKESFFSCCLHKNIIFRLSFSFSLRVTRNFLIKTLTKVLNLNPNSGLADLPFI